MTTRRKDPDRHPGRPLTEAQPDVLAIKRAVAKGHGDSAKAIQFICKHFGVNSLDALPFSLRATAHAALANKL